MKNGSTLANTFCTKCNRGIIGTPRYAAKSKKCQRWVGACHSCFPGSDKEAMKAESKAAVISGLKKRGGLCGYGDCPKCVNPFGDLFGDIFGDIFGGDPFRGGFGKKKKK